MRSLRVEARNYWRDFFINSLIASTLVPKPLRWRLLRAAGLSVERSSIPPGTFFGSTRVRIGERTHVSYGCFFDALDWITVGRNCDIAPHVILATSTHEIGPASRRAGPSKHAPITVGDGCWIGARAVILPGVTIGAGTIVAAGSVVISDCEPNSIYAGVPAILKGPADKA